jgi:hypothetical protein
LPPIAARRTASSNAVPARTPSGLQIIDITARDSFYEMPEEIPAGWDSITLHNEASQQRNAQFFKVNQGVTFDQLSAALGNTVNPVPQLAQFAGGTGTVSPGGVQTIVQQLSEGQYAMVTLLHDWYLLPHVPTGMVKLFKVLSPTGPQSTTAPQSPDDGTIHMVDFAYAMPAITPGEHTYKLTNEGQVPHEILIRKINAGKSITDVQAYVADPAGQPPPYDELGSGGALVTAPGTTEWMTLDLSAGEYVGICFVKDEASAKIHAQLGMVTSFTVK